MQILQDPIELKESIRKVKLSGSKIVYVPTMGFLHQGHLSLMEEAKKYGDILVVSIFVNPAQFNDPEDLKKYPIDRDGDLEKCRGMGVDIVFFPETKDIYPEGIPKLSIRIPHLMDVLCGASRPGHFEGILLVLSRLFHFVDPDVAIFGLKDYQQFTIVSEFVKDLAFPIEIIGMDTIREKDGLAMSSRNSRLSEKEREAANLIPRALRLGEKLIQEGERNVPYIREVLLDVLASSSMLKLDYLEFVNPKSLESVLEINKSVLIVTAVFAGNIRLIDNLLVEF
jgi:pantoate--beta-alanine ligase